MSKILILHELKAPVALSTLASRDLLEFSGEYNTFSPAGFLLKKMRGGIRHTFVEPGDAVIVVLAYADASDAEVESALEKVNPDLTSDELVDQAQARRVIAILHPSVVGAVGSGGTGKNEMYFDLKDVDLPSKGLPFPEGIGFKWCAYNTGGGALTTGSSLMISGRYMGVKLG